MNNQASWPKAIAHIDANAFFASVMQSAYPHYKNRPLVVGKERGIATAISYEARAFGIERGMTCAQVRALCPKCLIVSGNYSLFSLYSKRMFNIIGQFSPDVEQYSIDEAFVDLGCRHNEKKHSYNTIGQNIQKTIMSSLDIPVSVGISVTKVLSKLASQDKKPLGTTIIPKTKINDFLKSIPINAVWGIGPRTTKKFLSLGIRTAFDFKTMPYSHIQRLVSKPYKQIWFELRGHQALLLKYKKNTQKSICRMRTFAQPSKNKNRIWALLRENIEIAFARARRLALVTNELSLILKTQTFQYHTTKIRFHNPTALPALHIAQIQKAFRAIYKEGVLYRATGCSLTKLVPKSEVQSLLFEHFDYKDLFEKAQKLRALYALGLPSSRLSFGTNLWKLNKQKTEYRQPQMAIPFLSVSV